MGWIEKGQSAPFEHQPIDGLFFFDGDLLAKRFGTDWTKGQKYPMIEFPSGEQFELWSSSDPTNAIVHLFGEMDLRLKDTCDDALPYAQYVAEHCGYVVRPSGDEGIEVFGLDDDQHMVISYDATERRMNNVVFVRDKYEDRRKPELLDDKSRAALPMLRSMEEVGSDTLAPVKFFSPDAGWTWYASEFDGEDMFFGLVNGYELEYGYFTLSELEASRGPLGLPIERDRHYEPKTLRELQKMHEAERRRNL